jgi:threonine/homoserine/homoserine lactone efflux protein
VQALAVGFSLGFLVAAEIGPIWLLCARTALRQGFLSGWAIGAGAALIDLVYATLGVAGVAAVLRLTGFRVALGIVGALVLALLGGRTLLSASNLRETAPESQHSAATGFRIAVVATAANPLTIASWSAIFAAAAGARLAAGVPQTGALLVGVGAGSLSWFTILSGAVAALRRYVGRRALIAVDIVAGAGLVAFGIALLLRVLVR